MVAAVSHDVVLHFPVPACGRLRPDVHRALQELREAVARCVPTEHVAEVMRAAQHYAEAYSFTKKGTL